MHFLVMNPTQPLDFIRFAIIRMMSFCGLPANLATTPFYPSCTNCIGEAIPSDILLWIPLTLSPRTYPRNLQPPLWVILGPL